MPSSSPHLSICISTCSVSVIRIRIAIGINTHCHASAAPSTFERWTEVTPFGLTVVDVGERESLVALPGRTPDGLHQPQKPPTPPKTALEAVICVVRHSGAISGGYPPSWGSQGHLLISPNLMGFRISSGAILPSSCEKTRFYREKKYIWFIRCAYLTESPFRFWRKRSAPLFAVDP